MAFTETEKKNIKQRLLTNCELSWSNYGYKKTNIDELCTQSGISKGAFYSFYNSKEELFCEVLIQVQERLINLTKETLGFNPTKKDLARTLQLVFREYSKLSFVLETQTPDFIAFINKLSPEKIQKLEEHGQFDMQKLIKESGLTYQIDELKALSILALIFRPLPNNQELPYDPVETTEYMIETMVDKLFY